MKSQDASRFGLRLYGLFDGIEDEVPVDNDQSEDVGEHDDPSRRPRTATGTHP